MRSTPLWLRALLALVPLGAAQGSMHCVMSPTLWEGEKCSKYHYWLTLRSNVTTLWKLGCSAGSERCSNLLEKVILGLDALPATFHWRPQDTSLGLWIQGKGFEKNFSVTNTWHDLSVSPDGDESLCRVHSQSLKFSVPCYHNATERDYLRFGEKGIGQSLFALDCVKNSVFGDWEVPVILLSLGILLLLLLVFLLRVRKGRRTSKGVFPPEKDQRYTSLPFRSPPTPQDAKGGLRDLLDPQRGQLDDPEEDEEHVYCYMDMEVLRRQLGRDRQAAEQEQQEDLGAVSLSSHDSINSLYYELKAIEKMRGKGGRGEKEYEEEDSYEEVDRGEAKKDGDEEVDSEEKRTRDEEKKDGDEEVDSEEKRTRGEEEEDEGDEEVDSDEEVDRDEEKKDGDEEVDSEEKRTREEEDEGDEEVDSEEKRTRGEEEEDEGDEEVDSDEEVDRGEEKKGDEEVDSEEKRTSGEEEEDEGDKEVDRDEKRDRGEEGEDEGDEVNSDKKRDRSEEEDRGSGQ